MCKFIFFLLIKNNNLILKFFNKKEFPYTQEFFNLIYKNFVNSFLSRNFGYCLLKVLSINCIFGLKKALYDCRLLSLTPNEYKPSCYAAQKLRLNLHIAKGVTSFNNCRGYKTFAIFYTELMQFLNFRSEVLTMSFLIKESEGEGVFKSIKIKNSLNLDAFVHFCRIKTLKLKELKLTVPRLLHGWKQQLKALLLACAYEKRSCERTLLP